jgi:hypothetical protein
VSNKTPLSLVLEAVKPEAETEEEWKQKGKNCVGVLIGYGANPDESIEKVKNHFCPFFF